jgi:hypothetical protein
MNFYESMAAITSIAIVVGIILFIMAIKEERKRNK